MIYLKNNIMSIEKNRNHENIERHKESKDLETYIDNSEGLKKDIEKIQAKESTYSDLESLEELVREWIISRESADKIRSSESISRDEVEFIFDKIDEIDSVKDIDNYLPKDLRITKKEYIESLQSKVIRIKTLTKINMSLNFLSEQIPWNSSLSVNLFAWFLTVLDKNLTLIQENTIDIRDNLEKMDVPNKLKISRRKRLIDFFSRFFK